MRFILRNNLNKLAKKLRFLGYDVFVAKSLSIHNILRLANKNNAVVLTRSKKDLKLAKNAILIKSDFIEQQLAEIKHLIKFDESKVLTRCSICNTLLLPAHKPNLPEYILQTQNEIKYCPTCGRYYYKGTHFNKIIKNLKSIFA